MNEGVVYLAVGASHAREAAASMRSLKQHMPDLPVAVFTDAPEAVAGFDRVLPVTCEAYERTYNIQAVRESPFERTLFLDTDTFIVNHLHDGFRLLDRFDFAAAHAPHHLPLFRREGAPPSFPQVNGGVVFIRRNAATERLLNRWAELYRQDLQAGWEKLYGPGSRPTRVVHNQPSLRQALYEEESVRLATLPPEYNCRLACPTVLVDPVRILHGDAPDMASLAREINARSGLRVVYLHGDRLVVRPKPLFARVMEWLRRPVRQGKGS